MEHINTPQPERLSDEFDRLRESISGEHSTLSDLFRQLSVRDHPLIILILSLPFLIPVPMMGLSQLLGTVMITVSVAMMLGIPPWIPAKLARREIHSEVLKKLFSHGARISRRFEKYVRPRWPVLWKSDLMLRLHGIGFVAAAVLLILPGPPGTNVPPALALVSLSYGLMEEDGLLISLGYGFIAVTVAIFAAIVWGGVWIFEKLGLPALF